MLQYCPFIKLNILLTSSGSAYDSFKFSNVPQNGELTLVYCFVKNTYIVSISGKSYLY